jgi:hypothetical protein
MKSHQSPIKDKRNSSFCCSPWRLAGLGVNKGSPGIDGIDFEDIEQKIGIDTFLSELAQDLKRKTYRAQPVRRVMIPKADGSMRRASVIRRSVRRRKRLRKLRRASSN